MVRCAPSKPTSLSQSGQRPRQYELSEVYTTDVHLSSGASGRFRTHDLRFTKPLLCQLSYRGFLYPKVRILLQPLHFVNTYLATREGLELSPHGFGGQHHCQLEHPVVVLSSDFLDVAEVDQWSLLPLSFTPQRHECTSRSSEFHLSDQALHLVSRNLLGYRDLQF